MLGTVAALQAAMAVADQESKYQLACHAAKEAGMEPPTRDQWFGPQLDLPQSKGDGDWWSLGLGVLVGSMFS
jgi:hypothetical protein